MGRGDTRNKLDRIEQLKGLLKTGETFVISELANEFSISRRTLMRDLELLRQLGLPIEGDRGRGGGVRLNAKWGIGRIAFDYREAIDLLLALNVMDLLGSPIFFENLKSVRNKIFASFPDSLRPQVNQLRQRILIGDQASETILSAYFADEMGHVMNVTTQCFFELRLMDIQYKRNDGVVSNRQIEPHYLFLYWPIWYLISFDHQSLEARTFRLDRIKHAKACRESFSLSPISKFSSEIDRISRRL